MVQMLLDSQWSMNYLLPSILIMAGAGTILFIAVAVLYSRLNKMQRLYKRLLQGVETNNLEEMLLEHVENMAKLRIKVEELSTRSHQLHGQTQECIQQVGLIRFNAFQDMGSDLSFSAAMLDAKGDGFVLSSIYGRNESRVYAKPIAKGESTYFLSEEEQAALVQAKGKK